MMNSLTHIWQRYVSWWDSASVFEKWSALSVGLATLLGSTYRFIALDMTMQFLADQGRDAIIAYGILHGDIALVGPSTSVGNMYLGPLYYYFMAPWIALFGNSPIGPAFVVALLGTLTIPVLYFMGREWVGARAAVLATLLYASAPVVAEYTRFSWNPNPMPLVALFLLWSVWKAWNGSVWWWVSAAFWWAAIIQLHYVALLLAFPAGIFLLADMWRTWKSSDVSRQKYLVLAIVISLAVVLVSILPLVAFDIRFNGSIRNGFADFFDGSPDKPVLSFSEKIWKIFKEQQGRSYHVFFEIWGNKDWSPYYRTLNGWFLTAYAALGLLALQRAWKTRFRSGMLLLAATSYGTILGLAWYSGEVFHHYIAFFFPVSYLVSAAIIDESARRFSFLGKIFSGFLLVYILWMSVQPVSLRYLLPLGWTVHDYEKTAETILQNVPAEQSYTLANLSEVRDYRGLSYRYFLLVSQKPPVAFELADQADVLVVVADSPKEPEAVLNSPVYEISTFPRGEYRVVPIEDGPTLFFIQRKQEEPAKQ